MIKQQLLLYIAVVAAATSSVCLAAIGNTGGNSVNRGNCTTALLDTCAECYTSLDLKVTWMDGVEEDPNKVFRALSYTSLDPLVQCENSEAYKDAMECMYHHLETCSQPADAVLRLPDTDLMKQGMNLMCDKFFTVNMQCVKDVDQRVTDCGIDITRTLLQRLDPTILSNSPVVCLAYEVSYDCLEKFLTQFCDPFTAKAYLEIARWYAVPRACTSPEADPGRKNRIRHIKPSQLSSLASSPSLPAMAILGMMSMLSLLFL